MTRIYLIRAAEAEGELYHIAQGHCDSALTGRGRRQDEALKRRFETLPIDGVYTSDLYSARATAVGLAHQRGLTAVRREDLREINLGVWEGVSWGNLAYEEPRQFRNFQSALQYWRVEGAETAGQVQDRMEHALLEIAGENPDRAIAVVSHGFSIRLLLARLLGISLQEAHTVPVGENTAVSVIEAEGRALRLVSQNDAGHLESDAAYQSQEMPRTQPDFNPEMCFYLLRWVEYGEIMAEAVECVWQEAGEERPFNKETLLDDAGRLQTLVGYVEQTPAAFLQMGAMPGWITLLCTHPGCRRAGLGTQLVGQAAMDARAKGADCLRIALPQKNPYVQFFLDCGFEEAGELPDGRRLLEKDLRLNPELLNA